MVVGCCCCCCSWSSRDSAIAPDDGAVSAMVSGGSTLDGRLQSGKTVDAACAVEERYGRCWGSWLQAGGGGGGRRRGGRRDNDWFPSGIVCCCREYECGKYGYRSEE